MNELRFGSALSAIALATMLAGCATSSQGPRSASIFGKKVDTSNIGLATKALIALNANDTATAIHLAERAVANSPDDAGFRSLLGNAYFAAGRFASADSAFRDSLTLLSNQPSVVLKLALAEAAQGRKGEAVALLNAARDLLDVSDYGLALALAGQPQQAVAVLEPAARQGGADARLRQNLALAHALSGDWTAARTIAAQDLSADLVEARVREWMSLASPVRAADQVAAFTGIVPAASDPGQPVSLALRRTDTRQAEAAPAPVAPAPAPAPVVAARAPQPVAAPPVAVAQPVVQVVAAPAAVEPYYVAAAPAELAPPPPAPKPAPAFVAPTPTPAPVAAAAPAPAPVVKAAAQRVAKIAAKRPAVLPVRNGHSGAVVQLGAYGSPQRVAAAWTAAARRHALLRAYAPMSAAFTSPRGTVYRLSVRGFGSAREAAQLCASLRRTGGSCFVRGVAGDAPVQLAAR
jgi:Flp pilus assembly protein TadD